MSEKLVSPWLRRMEHTLVMAPVVLLGARALQSLLLHGHLLGGQCSASAVSLAAYLRCHEGLALMAAAVAMAFIAAIAVAFEPKHKNARLGASSGLMLGCLSVPLLFACQLTMVSSASSVGLLLWLSLCCAATGLSVLASDAVAAKAGRDPESRRHRWWDEALTIIILAPGAVAVHDTSLCASTLVVCFFFRRLFYFLMHSLARSFTVGEALAVATLLALVLAQATFSFLAHIALWTTSAGSEFQTWTQRSLLTESSSASLSSRALSFASAQSFGGDELEVALTPTRFYGACTGLLVGVIILGMLWFKPALVPYIKQQQQQLAAVAVEASEIATAEVSDASNRTQQQKLSSGLTHRTTATAAALKLATPSSSASSSSSAMLPRVVRACSVPILHLWMVLVIFGVVYPYIWLEMGCEPFTFIWRFLFSQSPGVPPAESVVFGDLRVNIGGHQVDLAIFVNAPRMAVIVLWCTIVAVGVFLCAPTGTASSSSSSTAVAATDKKVEDGREEGESKPPARIVPSTVRVAPAAGSPPLPDASAAASAASSRSRGGRCCFLLPALPPLPNILVRKYYHLLAVLLFLPAMLAQPGFVALAMVVALTVFVLLEYVRVAKLPPLGEHMHQFMKTYLDMRDSGLVILTHTYLLVGCALPLWFHLPFLAHAAPQILQPSFVANRPFLSALQDASSTNSTSDAAAINTNPALVWDMQLYLPALAGVLILGIGDSMASLFGVCFGRRRWFGSSRTLEGTLAAVASMLLVALATVATMDAVNQHAFEGKLLIIQPNWIAFFVATTLSCLLEACTTQIDNLFLPLYYYSCMTLLFSWH